MSCHGAVFLLYSGSLLATGCSQPLVMWEIYVILLSLLATGCSQPLVMWEIYVILLPSPSLLPSSPSLLLHSSLSPPSLLLHSSLLLPSSPFSSLPLPSSPFSSLPLPSPPFLSLLLPPRFTTKTFLTHPVCDYCKKTVMIGVKCKHCK